MLHLKSSHTNSQQPIVALNMIRSSDGNNAEGVVRTSTVHVYLCTGNSGTMQLQERKCTMH